MLSDIYDNYDKYSNTAMYKIVFSRLLHRKLLIVNSFFPGAQVILEWLQCLYKNHLCTENYFRKKKINYCYGLMPSVFQVICVSMVGKNSWSPASTETPE